MRLPRRFAPRNDRGENSQKENIFHPHLNPPIHSVMTFIFTLTLPSPLKGEGKRNDRR